MSSASRRSHEMEEAIDVALTVALPPACAVNAVLLEGDLSQQGSVPTSDHLLEYSDARARGE